MSPSVRRSSGTDARACPERRTSSPQSPVAGRLRCRSHSRQLNARRPNAFDGHDFETCHRKRLCRASCRGDAQTALSSALTVGRQPGSSNPHSARGDGVLYLPRVPSLETLGRRPTVQPATTCARPSSETLHTKDGSGPTRLSSSAPNSGRRGTNRERAERPANGSQACCRRRSSISFFTSSAPGLKFNRARDIPSSRRKT